MLTQSDILALPSQATAKLATLKKELDSTTAQVASSTDYSSEEYIAAYKRQKALETRTTGLEKLIRLVNNYKDAQDILSGGTSDPDMINLANEEAATLLPEIQKLYDSTLSETAKFQNAVMEIRAGAGGEEAALFAHELYQMYIQFGTEKGWKVEITDSEVSEQGGFRHADIYIEGSDAYYWLQHESGVHRVQRVPATESSGRIHTSTVSVAILPEVEDVDVQIDPRDIEMEAFRSGGAGGQSVNKTSSAVRLKHIPTGIIVSSQVERSQLKNRQAAMRLIKAKVYLAQSEAQTKELGDLRRSQIGSGGRSEKIRTYNFPQSRVTDHRIKKSWFNISEIMYGKIETLLNDVRNFIAENGIQEDDED
jgi:peptide chain release factor 1